MTRILSNSSYVKTASSSISLFYPRSAMAPGEHINGFQINNNLVKKLGICDTVVFSMYWKPIGDSFLFLSVVQACWEYLKLTRPNDLPKIIIDEKFSDLIKHISYLNNSIVQKNSIIWFKEEIKAGKNVVLVSDDNPFTMEENPGVFNSESYIYPHFYEVKQDKTKLEYPSRPARYFLTFEREVGAKLISDPNNSIPRFILNYDNKLNSLCIKKYNFNPDNQKNKYLAIISQTAEVEKKYGTLRYLRIANRLLQQDPAAKILLLANPKEESPLEWLKLKKFLTIHKGQVYLLDSDNFELLAYILSRCHLALGNDTGFSHLAAMSLKSNTARPVNTIILYCRHDYGKWSTGTENVYPIFTPLAKYLKDNNMSIGRDKIDTTPWGFAEWACSISVNKVYKEVIKLWQS